MRRFSQVDVFSSQPHRGNPLAVVHDAEGLTGEQMARFSDWTNLSETTFLLTPTHPDADYRVRIWSRDRELPFAGHPTIGSAHAWLQAGGQPRRRDVIVQECGAGPVELRREPRLAFAAPPLVRSGPADPATVARVASALGVDVDELVAVEWIDNGPGWVGVLMRDATAVLAIEPDFRSFGGLDIGVVGPYPDPQATGAHVEVRGFDGLIGEDPVTGSLNASIAQWLTGIGTLPASYVASQGTRLGRAGRVHLDRDGDTVWVGGEATTIVRGEVLI
jgi:PhzF family phenazine biosynthesis protein